MDNYTRTPRKTLIRTAFMLLWQHFSSGFDSFGGINLGYFINRRLLSHEHNCASEIAMTKQLAMAIPLEILSAAGFDILLFPSLDVWTAQNSSAWDFIPLPFTPRIPLYDSVYLAPELFGLLSNLHHNWNLVPRRSRTPPFSRRRSSSNVSLTISA